MADLLNLLYDGGDKRKPLSPLIDDPNNPGKKIGRCLGHNSPKDISEWAGMIFLLAGKKKKQGKGANNNSRNFECDSDMCKACLRVGTYLFSLTSLVSLLYSSIAHISHSTVNALTIK